MAVLSVVEESGRAGETHACQYVRSQVNVFVSCKYSCYNSIRLAPPLVISEEDLMKAVDIIRQSLEDLDKVGKSLLMHSRLLLT